VARGRPDLVAPDPLTPSIASTIEEPRKIKNVSPEYPRRALDNGTQGTVVLEAWIGTTGDIYHVRVLESVERSLDLAAVGAVSGWRYAPTMWRGVPVPVIMTVTVNFKIS
jgi:protein TonB